MLSKKHNYQTRVYKRYTPNKPRHNRIKFKHEPKYNKAMQYIRNPPNPNVITDHMIRPRRPAGAP